MFCVCDIVLCSHWVEVNLFLYYGIFFGLSDSKHDVRLSNKYFVFCVLGDVENIILCNAQF